MIEDEQRSRHWLYTVLVTSGVVAIVVICAFVLPLLAPVLNAGSLLGFPVGYYLAAQGVMIVLIVVVTWVGGRLSEIDRKFGAIDDL
jgi:putative solute:sodium symporter small subunit